MPNRLLSLDLQGYKTFANKTEFKFPANLTAIVGPNGSGKSNIADSIRWVLGEQAYSLLRGKKTVDMIFSGSEQRPRASMASASITFDNQNGWLPIEYSEVNLTRRAYRNGENEYLINNKRVRLKDFNELLANSGLAERNYTIIGQGLVDSALSLRPEDRRRFFEEAAGIGLYRSRREDATQKLDKTNRNVERIGDILTELKPRIRSLEKQQEKTKTYLQIDEDLKLLLKDWYGYYWHTTQKNLEEALAFNTEQQEQVDRTSEIKQQLESNLKESQDSLQGKREKLSGLHLNLSQLHIQKEENARSLAVLEEREKSQKSRFLETEKSINYAQDRNINLEEEIAELSARNKSDQIVLESNAKLLQEAKDSLQSRLDQRAELNKNLSQTQQELNIKKQESLRLTARMDGIRHQINLQLSDIDKITKTLKATKNEYDQSEIQLTELRSKKETFEQEIELINKEAAILNKKISENIGLISNKKEQKNKSEQIILKLESEVSLLNEAEEAMAGFSSGTKQIFDAIKSGKLSGNYELLMDYLDIPEEYEVAIAAVLGSAIEGIVVKNDSEIEAVLNLIESTNAARTIIIKNKKELVSKDKKEIPGNFVIASDLLANDNKNEPFISNLLSNCIITEDRRSAEKILPNVPFGYCVVTKKGEVYSTDQTITAGKETRVRTFSRKREKKSLLEEAQKTQNLLQQVNDLLIDLEKKNQEVQKTADDLDQKRKESEEVNNRLALELHKLEIEQVQRKKQLEGENSRLEILSLGIENENFDISELEGKFGQLEKYIQSREEEIELIYKQLKELPIEEIRSSVTSFTSKFAVAEQVAENSVRRLNERKELLISTRKTLDEDIFKHKAIKDQLDEIRADIEKTKNAGNELSKDIAELTSNSQPLEKSVENEITDQGKFLGEVDESRRKFAVAERYKLQAQMRVEKLRDKLDQYQKKISEDFEIIIEEDDYSTYGPKPLPFEGIVEKLPKLTALPEDLEDQITQQRSQLRRLGPINPNATREYTEEYDRHKFLSEQLQDLEKAKNDLLAVVDELDQLMKKEFLKTFKKVEVEFENIFTQLFNGGKAKLIIEDEENIFDSGIDIEATLPGRRKQELALLSGGERSLTAIALIFSLLKISPTPFCILDEIDAMLDESNVVKVGEVLKDLSDTTQFIIITHNRNTVQLADILYGVTMGKDSVSQVISLKLDELIDEMVH
ncbi:MAG: chromosome segregation protein SMC [Pelolinea sp.]|nr:chromosome segregation protein SMC [Pelolinea sp.]